ncbi:IDEAL domain-containing protein [Macrococcus epidermidis]|uniref:IDEAL domain-containing protein n=2 Tax=Staphylococcaceae TaxID=90964 RepID=A0A2G5NXF8_9STAP|nr:MULTISPECIES: IDEAL domain-containing protein [Macrococcus]MCG7420781.1 IDEAL domain-containing protein [Macrococcus epidermidis]MCH4984639.1 IDEAL domain-containing protein [Macrococcus sp. PK]RAI79421.1 IDEAL domain-containing protein [Macrococcus goetzii]RAK44312.1 IDEAL domain-containing protein [Macrococcus epidermidis]TDM39594.1 IDEAL domain-containing protein [Macrococcus goetzii]
MNYNQQTQLNGLETFVSNLNNLYIELIIDEAVKSHQKKLLKEKIDLSLLNHNQEAFLEYTSELKALEEI